MMMGASKVALLAVLAIACVSTHAEIEEEDPFDFDAEDEGVELDESDSGYGQKPLTKVGHRLLAFPCAFRAVALLLEIAGSPGRFPSPVPLLAAGDGWKQGGLSLVVATTPPNLGTCMCVCARGLRCCRTTAVPSRGRLCLRSAPAEA